MTTDGILFDVDDTLVDTKGAFARALAAVRAEYLPNVPPEREPELLSHWRTDPGGYYRRYTSGEMDHVTQRRLRAACCTRRSAPPRSRRSPSRPGTRCSGARSRVVDGARGRPGRRRRRRRGGAPRRRRDERGHGAAGAKLKLAGLPGLPVLVGVDTLGFGKPDPRVFLEGARLLGTDPARTAYVGDEPTVDALAAHEAGLTGVWLDRAGHRRGPGYSGPPLPGGEPRDLQDPAALRAAGVVVIETLADLPAALGYGAR